MLCYIYTKQRHSKLKIPGSVLRFKDLNEPRQESFVVKFAGMRIAYFWIKKRLSNLYVPKKSIRN